MVLPRGAGSAVRVNTAAAPSVTPLPAAMLTTPPCGVPVAEAEGVPSAPDSVAITCTVYSVPAYRFGIVVLVVVPPVMTCWRLASKSRLPDFHCTL